MPPTTSYLPRGGIVPCTRMRYFAWQNSPRQSPIPVPHPVPRSGASGSSPTEFKLRVLRLLGDSHPPKLELSRVGILVTILFVATGGIFAWSQTKKSESKSDRGNPVAAKEVVTKELEPFQGIWPMNTCDSENRTLSAPQKEVSTWRWEVKGNAITWSRSDNQVWHLTFKVDLTKLPKEIDLTYLDGPFKGKTCLGMYEWAGIEQNALLMSLQDPGAEVARPESISMTGGGQTSLIFLDPRQSLVSQAKPNPPSKPSVDPFPVPVKTPVSKELQPFQGHWAVDSCESEAATLKVSEWDARRWRWSTRLNSSHPSISYAVFCLKK